MKNLSGYLDDAYLIWLSSPINCCFPPEEEPNRNVVIVRPMRTELDQPRMIPAPLFASLDRPPSRGRNWVEQTKTFAARASSRGSFSVRRKLNAYNGPRRPRIGPPLEFRHVENFTPRMTGRSFRPLELSIYQPENRLSSLLPYFRADEPEQQWKEIEGLPPPPPAKLHTRNESGSSFTIPRKPLRTSAGSVDWTTNFKARPESISANELIAASEHPLPAPPAEARLKSVTEAPSYERLRYAIHEKFELEHRLKDIEEKIEVIKEERKSLYSISRPTSRAGSQTGTIKADDEAPLPPLPLELNKITVATETTVTHERAPNVIRAPLPLAERRPKTAPPPRTTVLIPTRLKSFTEASATFTNPSPSSSTTTPTPGDYSPIPPPPLPLVLQQPLPQLRKMKSFSRVSNWLFPSSISGEHTRTISGDSVTNTPKPITSREGFYQCIAPNQSLPPSSHTRTDSISTVSTLESELDEASVPTLYSPAFSPEASPKAGMEKRSVEIRSMSMDSGMSRADGNEKSIDLSRIRTFGEKEIEADETWRLRMLHNRESVGVAF